MEFFLDTVNIEKIKKYNEIYNIAGVTSNPTILSREQCDLFPTLLKIREIIGDKQLHVQVTGKTCEEMLKEAETIVDRIDKNVYIKVPTNEEGIKTMKALLSGAAAVTAPPEFYSMMFENPSVDSIMDRFDADWAKLYGNKRIYEI